MLGSYNVTENNSFDLKKLLQYLMNERYGSGYAEHTYHAVYRGVEGVGDGLGGKGGWSVTGWLPRERRDHCTIRRP